MDKEAIEVKVPPLGRKAWMFPDEESGIVFGPSEAAGHGVALK
jgi:hypothetical protein